MTGEAGPSCPWLVARFYPPHREEVVRTAWGSCLQRSLECVYCEEGWVEPLRGMTDAATELLVAFRSRHAACDRMDPSEVRLRRLRALLVRMHDGGAWTVEELRERMGIGESGSYWRWERGELREALRELAELGLVAGHGGKRWRRAVRIWTSE